MLAPLIGLCFMLGLGLGLFGDEKAEIKKTSLEIPPSLEELSHVTVGIVQSTRELLIASDEPYRVTDAQGRQLFAGNKFAPTKIRASANGIQIGPQSFSRPPLTLESRGGAFKVKGNSYRHALKIWREQNGTISVVNVVGIEDYLKGVLPREMTATWGFEALKAQAVASRTYALFKAIEKKAERSVLSQDVLSQVYGGKSAENPATSRAVEATAGEILTHHGKIFPAYFHSTCGGRTTRADYQWRVEEHPVLQGVVCDFCRESKHYRWSASFKTEEIRQRLRKAGVPVKSIQRIVLAEPDASGRPRMIVVEDGQQKFRLNSNDFRLWVDPMKLKSILISSVDWEGDSIRFRGKGWGHGVGLCQYGAKKLAELGYTYRQILDHYYPDAELTTLENAA